MRRKTLIFAGVLTAVLSLAGVIAYEQILWDMPKPDNSEQCRNTLDTHAEVIEDGNTTREIPDICLVEPRLEEFRDADENDKVMIKDGEWELIQVENSSSR